MAEPQFRGSSRQGDHSLKMSLPAAIAHLSAYTGSFLSPPFLAFADSAINSSKSSVHKRLNLISSFIVGAPRSYSDFFFLAFSAIFDSEFSSAKNFGFFLYCQKLEVDFESKRDKRQNIVVELRLGSQRNVDSIFY